MSRAESTVLDLRSFADQQPKRLHADMSSRGEIIVFPGMPLAKLGDIAGSAGIQVAYTQKQSAESHRSGLQVRQEAIKNSTLTAVHREE